MGNTFRYSFLAGLVLTLAPVTEARNPDADPDIEVSIRVYNYARVPEGVLERAQRETSHVLREAGVEAVWIACALTPEELADYPECNRRRLPRDLVLAIVPRAMAKRMSGRHDVFGVAASSESGLAYRASIFHHRIEEYAERGHASRALLLGHFIAHEIGHLLLGTDSHSESGIMHVPWNKRQIERAQTAALLFTPAEVGRIRENLAARLENQR